MVRSAVPLLAAQLMAWFWREYLPTMAASSDPRAAPLEHTLVGNGKLPAGLCPATVLTAEFDPLCAEGEAYGAASPLAAPCQRTRSSCHIGAPAVMKECPDTIAWPWLFR